MFTANSIKKYFTYRFVWFLMNNSSFTHLTIFKAVLFYVFYTIIAQLDQDRSSLYYLTKFVDIAYFCTRKNYIITKWERLVCIIKWKLKLIKKLVAKNYRSVRRWTPFSRIVKENKERNSQTISYNICKETKRKINS